MARNGVVSTEHVVKHGHPAKGVRNLVGSAYSEFGDLIRILSPNSTPSNFDNTAVGDVLTGQHINQCSLAGSVWADDRPNLTLWDRQAYAIQCNKITKCLSEFLHEKVQGWMSPRSERLRHHSRSSLRLPGILLLSRSTSPAIPDGDARTTTTSMTPTTNCQYWK